MDHSSEYAGLQGTFDRVTGGVVGEFPSFAANQCPRILDPFLGHPPQIGLIHPRDSPATRGRSLPNSTVPDPPAAMHPRSFDPPRSLADEARVGRLQGDAL